MPSIRIAKDQKSALYFVTFTVKNWYYLFDRHQRFEILESSFTYCQKHKDLKIYGYVFMLNHLHFIASAPDLIGVIRDIKVFLSKELKKNILATEPNVLKLFGEGDSFWEASNAPEFIESDTFFLQKLEYIHNNPVKKQYVHLPEDWRWSSASKIPGNIAISDISEFDGV